VGDGLEFNDNSPFVGPIRKLSVRHRTSNRIATARGHIPIPACYGTGFLTNFPTVFNQIQDPAMKLRKSVALLLVILGLGTIPACFSPKVTLQTGDRIVFLGDSITQLGGEPGGYVSLVRDTLTARHPGLDLEVIGAGISGNKVPDLQERLSTDVLSLRPSVVFVYIGINDVWHSTMTWGGTPKDRYEAGLTRVIDRITATGAQAILCTPTVIGERHDGTNPLDGMLDEYTEISRRVARATGVSLLNLRRIFLKYLRTHNIENLDEGILTNDGVHLNDAGNRLITGEVLSVLGEPGLD
jgi:lysophospholipase L1-like esterase